MDRLNNAEEHMQPEDLDENSVAIIGMAGRFPGATSVEQFWQNLSEGVESITQLSDAELKAKGVAQEMIDHPSYVGAAAPLPDVEWFDPDYFGMTQREAEITDPQHRVLLECAQDALDNAGYTVNSVDGEISLYVGVGLNTYLLSNLMPNQDVVNTMGMHQLLLGNDKCYAATRIAYKLNLKGACMAVDTACSTSLVSMIMGYKALLGYECDMVLAGGSKVNSADTGYIHEPGSINSADGHCRAFDNEASGTVFGSGAGMVVMKRYEDAVNDGDHILGIIRGGAINNDGAHKVGFTAPNLTGQVEVIKQAFAFAELPTSSISYVEAHGTGTKMGDPVEIQALSEAFKDAPKQNCFIGSVKSNVGHLETAAGVTGVIKVLKSFEYNLLPASLNIEKLNSAIDFANSPFQVVTESTPWTGTGEKPRRACVSSFGLGGTNAHIILEEPPASNRVPSFPVRKQQIVLLSAKSENALLQLSDNWQDFLGKQENPSPGLLQDMAYTSWIGRQAFDHRSFLVLDEDSAFNKDNRAAFSRMRPLVAERHMQIAWLLPGQGVQYAGMSADLYRDFAPFKEAMDACLQCYDPELSNTLSQLLLTDALSLKANDPDANEKLRDTRLAQPAIFAHGYALAKLLQHFGIQPSVLYGHSLGEILAAQLAGVFDLQGAATLVSRRAALMSGASQGSMLAVESDENSVSQWLKSLDLGLDIAAVNSRNNLVVSGLEQEIEKFAEYLQAQNIRHQPVNTSHAFHSRMMQVAENELRSILDTLTLGVADIAVISCFNGKQLSNEQLSDREYWVSQLTATVRFSDGAVLIPDFSQCAVDLGPGTTIGDLVTQNLESDFEVFSAGNHPKDQSSGTIKFLACLGYLWSKGVQVDWECLYPEGECMRTPLPAYPYQKVRCWIDTAQVVPVEVQVSNDDVNTEPQQPKSVEEQIAAIWQQLLGCPKVLPEDDFFALGGQSLLATRMLASVKEQTGVELSLNDFFSQPTVKAIADAVITEQFVDSVDELMLAELLEEFAD